MHRGLIELQGWKGLGDNFSFRSNSKQALVLLFAGPELLLMSERV